MNNHKPISKLLANLLLLVGLCAYGADLICTGDAKKETAERPYSAPTPPDF